MKTTKNYLSKKNYGKCLDCGCGVPRKDTIRCRPCNVKKRFIPYKERFLKHVEKTDSCWIWKGCAGPLGYGKFTYMGRCIGASRAAFYIFKGGISAGKYICHACDNPPCVNPDHLWEGTQKDNMQDALSKGRLKLNPPPPYDKSGENNPNVKLNWNTVREVRKYYRLKRAEIVSHLMEKYKLNHASISGIVNRKIWI